MQIYRSATLALAILLVVATTVTCSPLELLFGDYLDLSPSDESKHDAEDDYDIHYDQRQTGTENYRLNIEGVLIAAPAASENAIGSLGLLATNYLSSMASAASDLDEEEEEEENEEEAVDSDLTQQADKPYEFEAVVVKDDKDESSGSKSEHEAQQADLSLWQFKNSAGAAVQPANKRRPDGRSQIRAKSGGTTKNKRSK